MKKKISVYCTGNTLNNFKHILLSARWKVQGGEGSRRMGSHLWKKPDSLHRLTPPNSSPYKLICEEISLRIEEFFKEAYRKVKLTQECPKGWQTSESWAKVEEVLMLRYSKKPRRQVTFNLTINSRCYQKNSLNSNIWICEKDTFQLLIIKSNTTSTDTLIRVLQTLYHLICIWIALPKEQHIQISNKNIIPSCILTDACNISIIIGMCLKHVCTQKGSIRKLQLYSPSSTL